MDSPRNQTAVLHQPTPLSAVLLLTLIASVGTGVIWNGIPFIAKHDYAFTKQTTLLLYIVIGITYICGSLTTGIITRRLRRFCSVRSLLVFILSAQGIVCFGPWMVKSAWMLWFVAAVHTGLASFFWPMVESYLTSNRHGPDMRRAIGWFNIVWTGAVAVSLIFMAPLVEQHARFAIVGLGSINLAGLIPLLWFHASPVKHDWDQSQTAVGREYPLLLQAARILLPISYVINSAMSPLLPYLFQRVDLDVTWETPIAATWMITRTALMVFMWRLTFWHGRWGTLLLGSVSMAGGFALIVLGTHLFIMLMGLGCLGIGMGIIYYAALYYAMAVGRAEVDAGGRHESFVGMGYTIGPAIALISIGTPDGQSAGTVDTAEALRVVAIVWIVLALGSVAVCLQYLKARKMR